jgi:hypothetical protein
VANQPYHLPVTLVVRIGLNAPGFAIHLDWSFG